jgi:protein farnesyltransferase/geranylgeranyltransferase type-1 subunit alpha
LKEVWKAVNEGAVPLRVARVRRREEDKKKGLLLEVGVKEYEAKWERKVVLGCLEVESRCFRTRRERERRGEVERLTGEAVVVTEQEVFEEVRRRKEMAALRKELYGGGVGKEGKLAMDPEWDDVEPVVLEEPEGALAAISYSADYAEGEFSLLVGWRRGVTVTDIHTQPWPTSAR